MPNPQDQPSNCWYRFYPGDFARDTRLLSLEEKGAYRELIDFYMTTGQPIPTDIHKLRRVLGVSLQKTRKIISVLSQFFDEKNDVFIHKKCEKEIAKTLKARENASKGAHARWGAKRMPPEPEPNIKEKDAPKVASKKKSPIKKKSTVFVPPKLSEVIKYAQDRNSSVDPKAFFEYFHEGNWKDARGNQVKNWKQKFLTWEKHNGSNGNGGHHQVSTRKPTAVDRVRAATGLDEQGRAPAIIDITPDGPVVGEDEPDVW